MAAAGQKPTNADGSLQKMHEGHSWSLYSVCCMSERFGGEPAVTPTARSALR
jgi:hypothetical protein